MKPIKLFPIVILVFAFGCQPVISVNTSTSSTSTPQIYTATPSRTPTKTPTITATVTIEPMPTPLPTLNSREASLAVQKLLLENGNCQLPCWWGIVPGKTSWENTRKFLSPFASSFFESSKENSDIL